MDCWIQALCITDPDDDWSRLHCCPCLVEDAATVTQAVVFLIKSDDRCNDHIRLRRRSAGGNNYVPYATVKPVTRRPDTELQRPALLDNDGKCDPSATRDNACRPVAQIVFATDWPVTADYSPADIADCQVQP